MLPSPRLPVIAPKDDQSSVPTSPPTTSPAATSPTGSKTRLPPRSRTGCWTCRTRKVKCDEQRPTCSQCARLQHACDYNPRLSFRNDTPRVVGRYSGGSSAWEPGQSCAREGSRTRSTRDALPPFSSLTTDEDREKKAESREAGTFHVVVVPRSFSSLPEYRDEDDDADAGEGSEPDRDEDGSPRSGTKDPNVVILRHFEDAGRRPSTQTSAFPSVGSPAPLSAGLSGNLDDLTVSPHPDHDEPSAGGFGSDDRKKELLEYYRTILSPQLVWTAASFGRRRPFARTLVERDVFEAEVSHFAPLWHAMMALAALGLDLTRRVPSLDALQHYQEALSLQRALSSAEDISSAGAFFAHYLLLLYEIAAAGNDGQTLWQSHLTQLLRITLMRRERFGEERHTYLVWCTCTIDTYALLSRSSEGTYVRTLLEMKLLPTVPEQLPPLPDGGIFLGDERETLPCVLRVNHQMVVLAARIGLLARELRQEAERGMARSDREQRVSVLRRSIRRALTDWPDSGPEDWLRTRPRMPPRVRIMFEHAFALQQACVIYIRTSMWPYQVLELDETAKAEISQSARAILKLARDIVEHQRFQHRFVMFPVFMAGFVAASIEDRMAALEIMSSLERASLGRNASAMRQMLQAIYREQDDATSSGGLASHVDWVELVCKHDWQVVYFGL